MLNNPKVTFLMTFGHCGIDWMNSLLDSHKQILIIPAFSFYRCWKMLNADSASSSNQMFDIWNLYIANYIGPNSTNKQKQILHNNKELDIFLTEFRKGLESEGYSKISVFWALHEAYAKAKEVNSEKITCIVAHEHLPWPFEEMLSDFNDANFLMMIRDPRASIAGIIKGRTADFGFLPDFTFNTIFETWLQGNDINNKYSQILGSRLKIVKNEDLHNLLEENMRSIADWLKVDFNKSMLVPTNAFGVIRKPDSRYLDGSNQIINETEFFTPENVKKRWLSVLTNQNDILMIEILFKHLMQQFGYQMMHKHTHLSYLKGIILFILPNHAVVKKWMNDYPNLDDFSRIHSRIKKKIGFGHMVWLALPSIIKISFLYLYSAFRRIKIYLFPGNRWKRYDNDLKNY
jgi:hypothetical protein